VLGHDLGKGCSFAASWRWPRFKPSFVSADRALLPARVNST
jgi:hypothetical protein